MPFEGEKAGEVAHREIADARPVRGDEPVDVGQRIAAGQLRHAFAADRCMRAVVAELTRQDQLKVRIVAKQRIDRLRDDLHDEQVVRRHLRVVVGDGGQLVRRARFARRRRELVREVGTMTSRDVDE